jgi:DNA ligase 1
VLLSTLAEAWAELSATRSRNAKRAVLAAVLAEAVPDDIAIVVSYLGGSLRQRRTGLGYRSLQSVPAPATSATLSVLEVDAAFARMAELAGVGSASARAGLAEDLFARATRAEQGLLRGLVFGELRQGAQDSLVQDGLAQAYGVPVATVRRAAMLLSSTTAAAQLLIEGGERALEQVGLQIGTPIQPMLAAAAVDVTEAAERIGLPAVADVKLDGIRVQVHRQGAAVRIFTRSLDEITPRLPEVVAAVQGLPAEAVVLDGEVLALREDGRPEAFQVTAARTASSTDVAGVSSRTPLRVYFFDLLHVDGHDLLDAPLHERHEAMTSLLPPELLVSRRAVTSTDELAGVFTQAVADGYEGLVVKRTSAPYAAGRREASWIKIKPRHTFDLVVTAVEWGSGRRQGWLSNLHLAARDPETGGLVMLGKTFKGLTDDLLAWQTTHFLALEQRRDSYTVYVEPTTVVEIACDGLQVSRRYPGGVALRFARVLRYREDKSAEDADTIETVRMLLGPPEESPNSRKST